MKRLPETALLTRSAAVAICDLLGFAVTYRQFNQYDFYGRGPKRIGKCYQLIDLFDWVEQRLQTTLEDAIARKLIVPAIPADTMVWEDHFPIIMTEERPYDLAVKRAA